MPWWNHCNGYPPTGPGSEWKKRVQWNHPKEPAINILSSSFPSLPNCLPLCEINVSRKFQYVSQQFSLYLSIMPFEHQHELSNDLNHRCYQGKAWQTEGTRKMLVDWNGNLDGLVSMKQAANFHYSFKRCWAKPTKQDLNGWSWSVSMRNLPNLSMT